MVPGERNSWVVKISRQCLSDLALSNTEIVAIDRNVDRMVRRTDVGNRERGGTVALVAGSDVCAVELSTTVTEVLGSDDSSE
jgi:hypothetical protein